MQPPGNNGQSAGNNVRRSQDGMSSSQGNPGASRHGQTTQSTPQTEESRLARLRMRQDARSAGLLARATNRAPAGSPMDVSNLRNALGDVGQRTGVNTRQSSIRGAEARSTGQPRRVARTVRMRRRDTGENQRSGPSSRSNTGTGSSDAPIAAQTGASGSTSGSTRGRILHNNNNNQGSGSGSNGNGNGNGNARSAPGGGRGSQA